MPPTYTKEQYNKAVHLLGVSKIYAVTLITPLEKLVPEFKEIRDSELYDVWDYFITMTCVGFAYMLLADSFPKKESDSMAHAIQDALNNWEYDPFKYGNYFVVKNFLDTFDALIKEGLEYDIAIGTWLMIQLKNSINATPRLVNLTQKSTAAQFIGSHIITSFLPFWKKRNR